MGIITTARAAIAAVFVSQSQTTVPTKAEFIALSTGYTPMHVRRIFGGFRRGMKNCLRLALLGGVNNPPFVANALVDQSVAQGGSLSYAFASNSFGDVSTLVYAATVVDAGGLASWITFTPATRTFTGTAPAVAVDTVVTVTVTATDPFGLTAEDTFTITVTAV